MKNAIVISVLMALALVPAIAQDKPKLSKADKQIAQIRYIDSRLEEAKNMCVAYVHDNALDPESIKIDEKYEHGKNGNGPWNKNGISILLFGWGRNSYGAVLRHNFYCAEVCKPDQPCHVDFSREDVSRNYMD